MSWFRQGDKAKVVEAGHEFEDEEVEIGLTGCEGERSIFANYTGIPGLKCGRKYRPEDLEAIEEE